MVRSEVFVLCPPILFAVWLLWRRLVGDVRVRWWAWPVLLISLPLSMPADLWQVLTDAIQQGNRSACLAPWLVTVLCFIPWPRVILWVVALTVVFRLRGMVFASVGKKLTFVVPLAIAMSAFCLYELLLTMFFCATALPDKVAGSPSPDGRLLVRVFEERAWGTSSKVVCEWNDWFALRAKVLEYWGEFGPRGPLQVTWSKDSQVAVLMAKGTPVRAYSLPEGLEFKYEGCPLYTEAAEIERLVAEHGGPAP